MNKRIMISAGEASGDMHAANVVNALRRHDSQLEFYGMGGAQMQDAGVELLVDCSDIAVMGIVEVLLKYRSIMAALNILKASLAKNPPDLLILVDYQEFNNKLAEYAKITGSEGTVLYWPPGLGLAPAPGAPDWQAGGHDGSDSAI